MEIEPEALSEEMQDFIDAQADEMTGGDEEPYNESMDGDAESALASCGWGTDEDYGCFDGGGDAW